MGLMETLISSKDLCKRYADTTALSGLSVTVSSGEIVGLLGPNGAGKTTAIHIFLGLLSPTSGEVRIFGKDPLKYKHELSKKLNFSSAYAQLPSNLKVLENLSVFSRLYCVPDAKKKIAGLLELLDMTALAGRITGALSAGEKTRLNLCKCLLNDPELLLLDEPTASLDPEMADNVRKLLKKIQKERNIGILYTSHNMPEVEEICDTVYFIHEGRMIAEGAPAEVIRTFESKTLEQVFIKIVRSGDFVFKREKP